MASLPTPKSDSDEGWVDPWQELAEAVIDFQRKSHLIVAVEEGIWFSKSSSVGQLAAFLREQTQVRIGHELARNQKS